MRDVVSSLRKEDRRFAVIRSASDVSWDMSKHVRLGADCCSTMWRKPVFKDISDGLERCDVVLRYIMMTECNVV